MFGQVEKIDLPFFIAGCLIKVNVSKQQIIPFNLKTII